MGDHELPDGFKMTELGPLPEGWEVVTLGTVISDIISGDWGQDVRTDDQTQCLVLRGTDFHRAEQDAISEVPRRYISKSSLTKRRLAANDLLVEISGGSEDQPTGRIMLVEKALLDSQALPIVFSNFVKRLRLVDGVMPGFFYLYWKFLYQKGATRTYEKRTTGIRNFKLNDFLSKEYSPIPPLPEQRAIAHVLRTVQRAKEATERVIAAARELKKSLMRHLFTYGPVPMDQVDQVRLKETEIGPLPEHWEVVRLGEVCEVKGGKRLPKGHSFSDTPTKHPYIRVADFSHGSVSLSNIKFLTEEDFIALQRYTVSAGDVYISIAGTIGLVGIVPEELNGANLTENAARLVIKNRSEILNEFLKFMLSTDVQQMQISTLTTKTSQPKLALARIKQVYIPLPPLPEQRAIANILGTVDRKIQAEEGRKSAIDSFFKTLLHHLMTGRVRLAQGFVQQCNREVSHA